MEEVDVDLDLLLVLLIQSRKTGLVDLLNMSIGGPCLWVPSLSSPVPSPLSAVSSHFSAITRHGERASSLPRTSSPQSTFPRELALDISSLRRSAEMQRAGSKAENAPITPVPSTTASSATYGGEIPSHSPFNPVAGAGREDTLPRVKLEIPGRSYTDFSMSSSQGGSSHLGEMSDASQLGLDSRDEHDHDRESTISPSDERGDTLDGDDSKMSSLEKKKMKRFR